MSTDSKLEVHKSVLVAIVMWGVNLANNICSNSYVFSCSSRTLIRQIHQYCILWWLKFFLACSWSRLHDLQRCHTGPSISSEIIVWSHVLFRNYRGIGPCNLPLSVTEYVPTTNCIHKCAFSFTLMELYRSVRVYAPLTYYEHIDSVVFISWYRVRFPQKSG